jgi:hypothetical protein
VHYLSILTTAKEVKDMAKYLVLWRLSPTAPWPTDPDEAAKLNEMLFAQIDNYIKGGLIKEAGFFLKAKTGYLIAEGESIDGFRAGQEFSPFIEHVDVQEIVPYETGKETIRGVMKARAELMKK